jgi:UPF0176 protein
MQTLEHIAFYRFTPVEQPELLRQSLLEKCRGLGLKGTILLAREGVNGMLAGTRDAINSMRQVLEESELALSARDFKTTVCEHVPFKKMLVKVKREIVGLHAPVSEKIFEPDPQTYISPKELHEKLAAAPRNLVLLDVRNDFEVQMGSFQGSINPHTKGFGEFKKYVETQSDFGRDAEIVMFCTGGIRCEKASVMMTEMGYPHVRQLHGGILQYFIDTDGAGFEGPCFVFDERLALDKNLKAEPLMSCLKCHNPIRIDQTHENCRAH